MNKAINKVDGEGEMIIINEIIELLLFKGNKEINKIIFEETAFVDCYIHLLNSIQVNNIKEEYLNPLY
jgi:hypothetical protein